MIVMMKRKSNSDNSIKAVLISLAPVDNPF